MLLLFILRNYHEKIIEPIVSRCQTFNIVPPNRKDVAVHLAKIHQRNLLKHNLMILH